MSINFWDFFWATLVFFLLVSYLSLLFFVLADIIRNREMGRWVKFVWILLLILLPFLTALAYLIAHGQAMTLRSEAMNDFPHTQHALAVRNDEASAVNQIKVAKSLLDERVITQTEFQKLKDSILVNLPFSSGRTSDSGPVPQ